MPLSWLSGRIPKGNTTLEGRFSLNGEEIPFRLHRMVSRRRITLVVDPRGAVSVRGPWRTSLKEAERVLRDHAPWVWEQTRRALAHPPAEKTWTEGSPVPILGETLRLEFTRTGSTRQVGPVIRVPLAHRENGTVDAALEKWYRRRATAHFRERLAHWSARMGVTYTRLVVRGQKTRWGSCSATGTISLNWRLLERAPALVDYVIVHELAHRRHMNHDPAFWEMVARFDPDYARHRALLRHRQHRREPDGPDGLPDED